LGQLANAASEGGPREPGRPVDELDAAPSEGPGFRGEDQPAAPFIQCGHQRQQFLSEFLDLHTETVKFLL
jgi:hypothetical protein